MGGGQENANNFLLDGSDNNDAFSNVNAPYPFPDAIQEFSVQSSGLSARYGVHAGATVNAVTKSGTNAYHGSVFEFLRNPAVNAHHVLLLPDSGAKDDTMKRNQFGGTFGGPIKKDKLMFFVGLPGNPAVGIDTAANHHRAHARGNYWRLQRDDVGGMPKQRESQDIENVNGVTIKGTKSIRQASMPRLGLAEVRACSTTDPACGNISYSYPQVWNEDQGVAKVDWNLSPKQTMFTRYFATDSRAPLPFDTDQHPSAERRSPTNFPGSRPRLSATRLPSART